MMPPLDLFRIVRTDFDSAVVFGIDRSKINSSFLEAGQSIELGVESLQVSFESGDHLRGRAG